MDLEDVGRSQNEIKAFEAGDAAGVVDEDHIVPDPSVADAPHGDRVEKDGEGGVRDRGIPRHDGLGDVFALEGRWEIAQCVCDICKK